ncbi:MAG: CDC48 family AAA ATPase [Candidatus Odinarchaeota archaeon]
MAKSVKLRAVEARHKDVGRGRIRMTDDAMRQIGVTPGDIVEIFSENSGRSTSAVVWMAFKEDQDQQLVRIDGISRGNLKIRTSDMVIIRKADVKIAERVTLAPLDELTFDSTLTQFVKQKLLGYPVTAEDQVLIQLLGQGLRFIIQKTAPSDKIVLITDTTQLKIVEKAVMDERSDKINYEDIGGLDDAIQRIREMIELPLRHPELFKKLGISPPKGVLLHGPPGCGKTMIAKAVAGETNANFTSIAGPEIMSKFYGESEARLREIFNEAKNNAPSIIFIDEIDAIAPKREDVSGEVERRVVAQILALMDGLAGRGHVIVVGATNRANALDPALRRPGRFDREIHISVPTAKERLEILQIHTRTMPGIEDIDLAKIAEITHGFVGADLAALAREAAMKTLREYLPQLLIDEETISPKVLANLKVTMNHFMEALKEIQPSAIREVFLETPDVKWEDIGGLEEAKTELIESVEWPIKKRENLRRIGVEPPRGVLLFGPPGTGKTLMAKAVASKSEANFISVKGPELVSKWVGESEKAIRETFRKARMASPTVVFFDEIESIASSRSGSDTTLSNQRMISQLLTEMDGMEPLQNIVVIAATNRPDLVDRALLRPGRFDRIVYIKAPDRASRLEIFQIHSSKMPLAEDVNLEMLADMTHNYVGSDIALICREAGMLALREDPDINKVSMRHFKTSLDKIHAAVDEKVLEFYEQLYKEFKKKGTVYSETKIDTFYG